MWQCNIFWGNNKNHWTMKNRWILVSNFPNPMPGVDSQATKRCLRQNASVKVTYFQGRRQKFYCHLKSSKLNDFKVSTRLVFIVRAQTATPIEWMLRCHRQSHKKYSNHTHVTTFYNFITFVSALRPWILG